MQTIGTLQPLSQSRPSSHLSDQQQQHDNDEDLGATYIYALIFLYKNTFGLGF